MQIGNNTTGMPAAVTMATDKDGRDWCVVVIKGTFAVGRDGATTLAEEQLPFVYADEHYGDPATTSIRAECDFARVKPQTDVILRGHAVPADGRPVAEMDVTLEVGPVRKTVHVTGNRVWQGRLVAVTPSAPEKFDRMPLVWERSFGGVDESDPARTAAEMRNLVGVGFRRRGAGIEGQPLPNLDAPGRSFRSASDTSPPVGLGVVGRSWQPRLGFAGTYDQQWLDERFPFLPADFDDRYFQSAPADQQLPQLRGGEPIRCTGVRADGPLQAAVPAVDVPLIFCFRDRDQLIEPKLDTVIVDPDQRRLIVAWRGQAPLGRKLTALREVKVGPQPLTLPATDRKRRFGSLADLPAAKSQGVI
jgi:hypothetical protein